VWQPPERVLPNCSGPCADDHISLKADSTGRVFAATKTSFTTAGSPLIFLSIRSAAGAWSNYPVGLHGDHHTRPIVLLAEDVNRVVVVASQPETGGAIYYKGSLMNNIAFPSGLGTLLISSSTDTNINNATSTKGDITQASGLVVLASDSDTRRYLHNELAAPVQQSEIRNITFENASLIDPAAGVDRVNGSVQLEGAAPVSGAYSARISGATDSYLEENFTAVDDVAVSLYLRIDALPAKDVRILQISNNGTTEGNLVLLASGALRLRAGVTNIGVPTPPLAAGQVYGLKLRQRRGAGADAVLEAFVAAGSQTFGSAFASIGNGTWTTAANRVRLGGTNGVATWMTLDDIRLTAGGQ
jgi:hypothetical protein